MPTFVFFFIQIGGIDYLDQQNYPKDISNIYNNYSWEITALVHHSCDQSFRLARHLSTLRFQFLHHTSI